MAGADSSALNDPIVRGFKAFRRKFSDQIGVA
jgi:hypothetical protein